MKQAGRVFAREPKFAIRVTLLLGAAMFLPFLAFQFLYDLHLRPLPLPDSVRLVSVRGPAPDSGSFSLAEVAEWSRTLRSVAVAAYRVTSATFSGDEGAVREPIAEVAPSFFPVLGAQPAVGRLFEPADRSADRIAVISHRLWQSQFGGRPDVVGRTVTVSGHPFSIAGVTQPDFAFFPVVTGADPSVYLPVDVSAYASREQRWWRVVGRLRPGASLAAAREEFAAARRSGQIPVVVALAEEVSRPYAGTLWRMMYLALLVLLCATSSAGAALLGRSVGKRVERAVRTALGATPGRLALGLFQENLALALCGALCGFALTLGAARWLRPFVETYLGIPRREPAAPDLPMAAAMLGVALLTAAIASLPAVFESLRSEYSLIRGTVRRQGVDAGLGLDVLTAGQIALAVVLLAAAASAQQISRRAETKPLGYEPRGLLALRVLLPRTYALASAPGIVEGFLEYARTIPGVEAAAGSWQLPLHNEFARDVEAAGAESPARKLRVRWQDVTAGYFAAVQAEAVAGASVCGAGEVVVNEALARELGGGQNALGRSLRVDGEAGPVAVRGVVRDAHVSAFLAAPPTVYRCRVMNFSYLILRAPREGAAALRDLAAHVRRFDREIVVDELASFEDRLATSLAVPRLLRLVSGGLAAIALLLTLTTLHGLVAAAIAARRQELAVRLALGAPPSRILLVLLRRTLRLLVAGAACGFAAAWAGERFLQTSWHAVDAGGTAALAIAVCGVCLLGIAACLLSARRVFQVDLRSQL